MYNIMVGSNTCNGEIQKLNKEIAFISPLKISQTDGRNRLIKK